MDANRPAIQIDRVIPTRRPNERPIGHHIWSNLSFVHWRVPAAVIESLLPKSLTLDTWDGDAFVGLVPFFMSGVRPWWSPPVPGISSFCETNVRTYVHMRGRDPGVWFFSLDAASSLAVRIARWRWHLPYFRAEMQLHRQGQRVTYASRRLWPGATDACLTAEAEVGPLLGHEIAHRELPAGLAIPGSLEHFLIERYILFSVDSRGALRRGRVHHAPYPIRTARLVSLKDSLVAACGIAVDSKPCHVAFSDQVRVEVFPLRHVD
jgi:uncharacterized protein YqjF (DUF2071 family)